MVVIVGPKNQRKAHCTISLLYRFMASLQTQLQLLLYCHHQSHLPRIRLAKVAASIKIICNSVIILITKHNMKAYMLIGTTYLTGILFM